MKIGDANITLRGIFHFVTPRHTFRDSLTNIIVANKNSLHIITLPFDFENIFKKLLQIKKKKHKVITFTSHHACISTFQIFNL